jgi:hypothetical protein
MAVSPCSFAAAARSSAARHPPLSSDLLLHSRLRTGHSTDTPPLDARIAAPRYVGNGGNFTLITKVLVMRLLINPLVLKCD